jgi:pantetheine-phosphate adenylyltransferase
MASQRCGVYPGTFDPLTNGHLDIIQRATRVVDRLIVAVAVNIGKEPLFTLEERVAMLTDESADVTARTGVAIEVAPFDNLLTDFVAAAGASLIIRGLRAVSDFEYEFQMTGMNARLNPDVETVFLMASEKHQFIASRLIKEIGRMGGNIDPFVPSRVKARLEERFAGEKAAQ